MKPNRLVATISLLGAIAAAQAQTAPEAAPGAASTDATAAAMTAGEGRKVDKPNGRLTLKHAEIANLEIPGMTMVFRVGQPEMLDQVQPGDKVRFTAEKVNGAITVTRLERL